MTKEEAMNCLAIIYERSRKGERAYHNKYQDAFDMAIEALNGPQWIPCSERLPEFGHVINPDPEEDSGWDESPFVLVCFDDGDIECRQFIREDGMVSIYPEEFRGRKATAWMPLPEPYAEEST